MQAATPRQQFLLAEVQAGTVAYNGACLGARGKYCIEREGITFPRVQRQPSTAEMDALLRAGFIKRKRMTVTITPAGRKALRKVGGWTMDDGLHIDMHVAPDGRTTTRFQTEGIALAEVGPLIDKAIAAMRAERAEMPPSHEPSLAGDEMVLARHAAALRAGPDTLTDLACIEYAVQKVLLECRKANPNHMAVPADGATVMRWLAAAISEAKDLRT